MIKHKTNLRLKRITLILASALYAGAVFAETIYAIQIPAQRLDLALQSLAQQSGTQILFVTKAVNNYQSETLNQELTVEQALQQLLKGKNLQIKKIGENKFSIVEGIPQARNMGQLKPIDVNASGRASRDANAVQLPAITVVAEEESYVARKVSIGKTEQSLKEIPQSVSVMTQKQIEDQGFTSIAKALNQATGVTTTGEIGRELYQIRFAAANTQVNGVSWSESPSNEDPALFERIEILKGPTSLLTGSGEPSGSINFVRKRPTLNAQGSAAISGGSWGSYRSEFDVSSPFNQDGSLRGRLVAVQNSQGKHYDHAKNDEKTTVYGVVEYDIVENATLGLSSTYVKERYINNWGLPFNHLGQVPNRNAFVGYNKYSDKEQIDLALDFQYKFDNDWVGKISFNHRELENQYYGLFAFSKLDINGKADVGLGYIDWDRTEKNYDIHFSGPIHVFDREHKLLIGYNVSEDHDLYGNIYAYPTQVDVLNQHDYSSIVNKSINSTAYNLNKKSGFYISAQIRILDPLTLTLGGRLSDYKPKSRTIAETTTAWIEGTAKVKNEFTPYVGLVWDLNEQFTWYASYAESFVPQTSQNYLGEALDPRIGWQIETGVKADFLDGDLNVTAAIFQIRDRNRGVIDPLHTGCPGRGGICYQAAGEVQSRGVELEITGKPTPNWSLITGYTYNNLEYLNDSNSSNVGKRFSPDVIPEQTFKLWSVYQFDKSILAGMLDGMDIGVGVQAQSDVYTTDIKQSGYATVNARIGYQINPNWQISLQGNNLFDTSYLYYPGYASYYNIYGEPRNFLLTLRAKY
ncbi:TonB-dependent siderophore receptor [Acinetobacter puyangensis]|uniref:Outer-membrane receptor for ferric coprogen and ferric-rhodotorulic acid n=1 Tax=Acinetobacter puyangensis TaxID=1096779 RepID=A0A240ECH6_9GAMM|nr:TonB-dependent receptor [Acinetobacter puyangensis]SNX46418.1 outer-membrane receptor for ferric coprogen and ferric-rhodotorulic acid [Acinetobacter puyangensis]